MNLSEERSITKVSHDFHNTKLSNKSYYTNSETNAENYNKDSSIYTWNNINKSQDSDIFNKKCNKLINHISKIAYNNKNNKKDMISSFCNNNKLLIETNKHKAKENESLCIKDYISVNEDKIKNILNKENLNNSNIIHNNTLNKNISNQTNNNLNFKNIPKCIKGDYDDSNFLIDNYNLQVNNLLDNYNSIEKKNNKIFDSNINSIAIYNNIKSKNKSKPIYESTGIKLEESFDKKNIEEKKDTCNTKDNTIKKLTSQNSFNSVKYKVEYSLKNTNDIKLTNNYVSLKNNRSNLCDNMLKNDNIIMNNKQIDKMVKHKKSESNLSNYLDGVDEFTSIPENLIKTSAFSNKTIENDKSNNCFKNSNDLMINKINTINLRNNNIVKINNILNNPSIDNKINYNDKSSTLFKEYKKFDINCSLVNKSCNELEISESRYNISYNNSKYNINSDNNFNIKDKLSNNNINNYLSNSLNTAKNNLYNFFNKNNEQEIITDKTKVRNFDNRIPTEESFDSSISAKNIYNIDNHINKKVLIDPDLINLNSSNINKTDCKQMSASFTNNFYLNKINNNNIINNNFNTISNYNNKDIFNNNNRYNNSHNSNNFFSNNISKVYTKFNNYNHLHNNYLNNIKNNSSTIVPCSKFTNTNNINSLKTFNNNYFYINTQSLTKNTPNSSFITSSNYNTVNSNSTKSTKELFNVDQLFKIEDYLKGIEKRTTLMIRNVPNRYDVESLLLEINDQGFKNKYDCFYLPIDIIVSLIYSIIIKRD